MVRLSKTPDIRCLTKDVDMALRPFLRLGRPLPRVLLTAQSVASIDLIPRQNVEQQQVCRKVYEPQSYAACLDRRQSRSQIFRRNPPLTNISSRSVSSETYRTPSATASRRMLPKTSLTLGSCAAVNDSSFAIPKTCVGPGMPFSSAALAKPHPPPRLNSAKSASYRLLIERASSPR